MASRKKYCVILGDGMSDRPIIELDSGTPLSEAKTPNFDMIAKKSLIGLLNTVPAELSPGSDVANLSIMGYDPRIYHKGRSPLEAANMGIEMLDYQTSFRCNLVTLSEDEPYNEKTMVDYSSGEITSQESKELIGFINENLSTKDLRFFPGVSYRHIMIWDNAKENSNLTPPHDISGRCIKEYIPDEDLIYSMMVKSFNLLDRHPINMRRRERGLNPANSIWIWGEGKSTCLIPFSEKYGVKGGVISAVDLVNGIARCAKMDIIHVEGATGNIDTNFIGKAQGAVHALQDGLDFVYVHIEAPDESSHHGSLKDKIKSIEEIDHVAGHIYQALKDKGFDFSLLVLPDHATPLSIMTHSHDLVPFMMYDSLNESDCPKASYNEKYALSTGINVSNGFDILDYLFGNKHF